MWAAQCNLDLFRRHYHNKNVTIYNMQKNNAREREERNREREEWNREKERWNREREKWNRDVQTLKMRLAAEKCKGKRRQASVEESDGSETRRSSGQEESQEQLAASGDEVPCQETEAGLHPEQTEGAKTTKQRRLLSKDALADSLTIVTRSCGSAQAALQIVEDGYGRAQQKRKRQAVRTGSV
jgi:chromosome segregation ATPase